MFVQGTLRPEKEKGMKNGKGASTHTGQRTTSISATITKTGAGILAKERGKRRGV